MDDGAQILSLTRAHAIATWRNVLIQIWELENDPVEQRREFQRILQAFKEMKPSTGPERPLLCIAVVSEHTNMPDAATRRIASEYPTWFDYYVGVHEGVGFRSSLVRAVVSGMALAARVKARYEVCGDLRHGSALLAARSAGTVERNDVFDAVNDLRARIAELR